MILTISQSNAEEEKVFIVALKNKTFFWPNIDPSGTLARIVTFISWQWNQCQFWNWIYQRWCYHEQKWQLGNTTNSIQNCKHQLALNYHYFRKISLTFPYFIWLCIIVYHVLSSLSCIIIHHFLFCVISKSKRKPTTVASTFHTYLISPNFGLFFRAKDSMLPSSFCFEF